MANRTLLKCVTGRGKNSWFNMWVSSVGCDESRKRDHVRVKVRHRERSGLEDGADLSRECRGRHLLTDASSLQREIDEMSDCDV